MEGFTENISQFLTMPCPAGAPTGACGFVPYRDRMGESGHVPATLVSHLDHGRLVRVEMPDGTTRRVTRRLFRLALTRCIDIGEAFGGSIVGRL
jgi:hypothetical protein